MSEQRFMPVPRQRGFAIEIVEGPAFPEAAAEAKAVAVMIDRDGVRGEALDLHSVGTGSLGRVDQAARPVEIAAVVAAEFGDDIRRLALTYRPSGDLETARHFRLLLLKRQRFDILRHLYDAL